MKDNGKPRALRADARRNREAILSAAREVFETDGVLVPLDSIAVRAGIGNATLYRNFPTRDDLLTAVMATSIEAGVARADELMRSLSSREALAEWLVWLTWQLRIWNDLPHCVATAHEEPDSSLGAATQPLVTQTDLLLTEAQKSGDAIRGITAQQIFELVTALSWGVDRFGDDEHAARRRVHIGTSGIFTAGADSAGSVA